MKLQVSTYRIGSPRAKSEGLRIGTVRFIPRGVKKTDYSKHDFFDVWLPLVAPSRELLKSFTSGKKSVGQFFRAYRAEMREPAAKHLLDLLAKVAQRTPISVGCYCEDETRCHRSVLIELIREAPSGT
jgi:uncharacterized protein YeaO (DUF488 family)